MSDITFLPSGVGSIKSMIRTLARKKQDWDIEILEGDAGRTVKFEEALTIKVPHEFWNEFSTLFDSTLEQGSVGLGKYLREAFEEDLEGLRKELKPALTKMFHEQEFKTLDKAVNMWRARFGISRQGSVDVAVDVFDRHRDIQKLVAELYKSYGNDKGNLELLIAAIHEKETLNAFDVFRDHNFLYGTKIISVYHGVAMTFEATIDLSYMVSQSIVVDNFDVLDEVEEQKGIKVVKNIIYPVGDTFSYRFFRELKDAIGDVIE
jgi:hypothetical protein